MLNYHELRAEYKLMKPNGPTMALTAVLRAISATILVIMAVFLCSKCAVAGQIDLSAIATIESSNNPLAYNKGSKATGKFQITPICLEDYNQYHKSKFTLKDMYNPLKAELVASWYFEKRIPQLLKHFGIDDTIRTRLWAYNAGIGLVKRGIMPSETKNYLKKYLTLTKGR